MDDKELEELMSARFVPPMRSNLEHRIIQASLNSCSDKVHKMGLFAVVLDGLLLPRPALSLAVVLVLGVAIGQGSAVYSDLMVEGDGVFMALNNVEYGDFL